MEENDDKRQDIISNDDKRDITVKVYKGYTADGLERALKVFKKKIQAAGLFKELKDRRYAEKPGDKKRRKQRENARRRRKTKLYQGKS